MVEVSLTCSDGITKIILVNTSLVFTSEQLLGENLFTNSEIYHLT